MKERIVAEISKNWPRADNEPVLAQIFEEIIEVNRLRGYQLESWRLSQLQVQGGIVETIIAVFCLSVVVADPPQFLEAADPKASKTSQAL